MRLGFGEPFAEIVRVAALSWRLSFVFFGCEIVFGCLWKLSRGLRACFRNRAPGPQ